MIEIETYITYLIMFYYLYDVVVKQLYFLPIDQA